MGMLRVSLFGTMRVTLDDSPEDLKLTQSISLLLAYLLLDRQRLHPREMLIGQFWGEYSQKQARNCLNTALWRLRSALRMGEGSYLDDYLITNEQGVGFNCHSAYWLDVAEFEEQVSRVVKQPEDSVMQEEIERLDQSLQLYQGELLEGVYTDWALRQREQKRLLYLKGLAYLLEYYKRQGAYDRSLDYGEKILAADPLREEIHREMMRLYLLTGQRALAVRQYEICRSSLSTELDVLPMEETQALYEQIAGERKLPAPLVRKDGLDKVLRELYQTHQSLAVANKRFNKAIRHLEEYLSFQK